MKNITKIVLSLSALAFLSACGGGGGGSSDPQVQAESISKEALGKALYSEPNLSFNRTQSCATCHNLDHGLVDDRANGVEGAVSLGDDGASLGNRNAPTAAYAALTPVFTFEGGEYIGGQFLDGRASRLEDQAGGPPLNPVEMNMPSKQAVVDRLMENADYVAGFKGLYGENIFDDINASYTAMTEVIAAFERTKAFSTFDSKYDKYLKGEYTLTAEETTGKNLFFAGNNNNCNNCHQLKSFIESENDAFTNYKYENIGVPANTVSIGLPALPVDHGLMNNPTVQAGPTPGNHDGKFRIPTLRNVAVTAPYMHNGVFKNLKTVVEFYDHMDGQGNHSINPETGNVWNAAEVPTTVNTVELESGLPLSNADIDALVAFMKILTDEKYEHLIP
ncbi:MAG: methylamine utilization protein MauG [Arcobacter sp.]|nr:MAG: methylamine utilization protein MauG [Arcobacter sp.]